MKKCPFCFEEIQDAAIKCKHCGEMLDGGGVLLGSKRLYRSSRDKMLCGVCGGLAEYLDMDPTIVRILAVLLVLGAGTGVVAYIVMALVIPEK